MNKKDIVLQLIEFSPYISKICRGIKTQRTIKTKIPLQFCMNGLTIMIGQLGLVMSR